MDEQKEYTFTSIEIAKILQYEALTKEKVTLNKTQLQKLLYILYGLYLAGGYGRLFEETPKAWPYGPIFPRVYKKGDISISPESLNSISAKIDQNDYLRRAIDFTVKGFSHQTASSLSEWSHESEGPWFATVYGAGESKWNDEISDELISNYFKAKFFKKR